MVAVTGASGLIGRHIVEKLVSEGTVVVALVRNPSAAFPAQVIVRHADVLDPLAMEVALEGVSAVIHTAAFVSFNPRKRKDIMEVNVDGTRHLINLCLRMGVKHFIHISSVAALGRKPGEIVTEDHLWTGLGATDYALSKYLAELEVYRGAEEGMIVNLLNPSVVLSASQLHRSSATLFDYVWNENRFYTHGMLNYIDVRDVADAVHLLLLQPQPGQKFILSAGSISYKEFFTRVATQWKKQAPNIKIPLSLAVMFGWLEEIRSILLRREPLVTRQSAAITVRSYKYDNSRARALLGVPFREINQTIAWCCEDYKQNIKRNK